MPLEVRELTIKVTVGEPAAAAPEGGEEGGDDQVRQIVEKVLEALEKKAER
ncbi:MAG: DUF5908 family protein [Bacteroidota bacterium]